VVETIPFARPRADQQTSPYQWAFVILVIGLAVPGLFRKPADWDTVYVPAAARLRTGEDLFQQGYYYPPAAAWLTVPVTCLPPFASRFLWCVASVGSLAVLLRGAWHLSGGGCFPGTAAGPHREHLILLGGLACGLPFVLDCWSNRQIDVIVAAIVIHGCLQLSADRSLIAGAWFGLAAALKCTPLLWAPYLVWRRQFLAASLLVGVAIVLNLAPDWTHPSPRGSRFQQWVTCFLTPMTQKDHDPGVWASAINFNHSVAGVCNRWLTAAQIVHEGHAEVVMATDRVSPTVLKTVVYGIDAALAFIALLAVRRRRHGGGETSLEYCLVLLLMLLLSPMSSKPHFCTLVFPGFCMARIAVERRGKIVMGLLGSAIVLVLFSNKDLCGARVYDFALWYGSVVDSTAALFLGCAYAAWRYQRANVASQSDLNTFSEVVEYRRAA
jgi:hypothetical protein